MVTAVFFKTAAPLLALLLGFSVVGLRSAVPVEEVQLLQPDVLEEEADDGGEE